MYQISIKTESGTSSVPVTKVADLDQAIGFGFQLHQASTCKHCIIVSDGSETLATFVRKDSFILPAPSQEVQSSDVPKKTFGLRKK